MKAFLAKRAKLTCPFSISFPVPLSPDCFLDDTKIDDGTATPIVGTETDNVVTSQECQDLCLAEPACLFWTWGSPSAGVAADQFTCRLYSSAPVAAFVPTNFYVSGPRECNVTVPAQNETNLVDTRKLVAVEFSVELEMFTHVNLTCSN